MRKIVLAVLLFAAAGPTAAAEDPSIAHVPTGIEWLHAGPKEREEGLLATLLVVQTSGVRMEKSFLEYDDAVRRQLLRHPETQEKPLTDALAGYLYESDPSTRPILDKLRSNGKTPG